MTKLDAWKIGGAALLLCVATAICAQAQRFVSLVDFDGTNGEAPEYMSLVQGIDGNFYGTTGGGGANCPASYGCGTVFKVTADGTAIKTLYSFCSLANCADGNFPIAGLTLGTDGNFYGTTYWGGGTGTSCPFGCGTIFKMTPGGRLATLHSFCSETNCPDGYFPWAGLMQATNGNFYGTTLYGGLGAGDGTVFEITPEGAFKTVYSFCSKPNCTDGQQPYAGLVQANDGNLYGTTYTGGSSTAGTLYRMTLGGKLTTVYTFCSQANCADGGEPHAGLMQGSDGNLYGTASQGGLSEYGTVFGVMLSGQLAIVASFAGSDGTGAASALIQATNGTIYGTAPGGGDYSSGTVFYPNFGGITTVYNFCSQANCADGAYPYGGLFQATNGTIYGTTGAGGAGCGGQGLVMGCGTVFGLYDNLAPFIKTLPTAAKVGSEVGILGNNLTAATGVNFNGTPAKFSTHSSTLILTRVPAGASTGTIQVTLPGKTLSSNVPFIVIP